MENHILHFSSPKQNNDFIVYHNRAKSTLGGAQTTRLKGKIMVPESARDYNSKRPRPDRHGPAASSDFTSPTHGYPLHNRINIVKELLETSDPSSPSRKSFEVDVENQRKVDQLEEENRELKKRLKARDVRIAYLVQENEAAREKLEKIIHLENLNQLSINENKAMKSEIENLSKKLKEMEVEKAAYMSDWYSSQRSSTEDTNRGLLKYIKHIIKAIESMENNSVALFYFEERFSGEKQLSKLMKSKDYATIALNSFRYISDLLAHVVALAQPKRDHKKTHLVPKDKKEQKVQPSEPSSICLSPLRNDSRENTPRSLVRELEGRGMALEGFEKVHEGRSSSPYNGARSAEGRRNQQDLVKKCQTTRESKQGGVLRGSCDGVGQLIKKKNAAQVVSGKNHKSGTASYAQMHGRGEPGRVRTRENNEKEVLVTEGSKQAGKKKDEERYLLIANKKRDIRSRETEEEEIDKIKAGLREETPRNMVRRKNEEEDMETYASLGVNIRNFAEGQFGRRTKEYERNDKESVSVDRDEETTEGNHAFNVKALLRQGLGIQEYDERVETRTEEVRKENGKEKVYSRVRGSREDNGLKRVAGRCSEDTDAEKLSKLLSYGSEHEEREENYGGRIRKSHQIERPEDMNRGNFQNNRDNLRAYSVHTQNEPFGGNGESPRTSKTGERYVTFDGTDNQSLFASERDPGSAHKMKRGTHKASESEYYSVNTRTDHNVNHYHQRFSSDTHSAGLAEAMLRKRMDQEAKSPDMLYGISGEAKRGKAGRGDFNN